MSGIDSIFDPIKVNDWERNISKQEKGEVGVIESDPFRVTDKTVIEQMKSGTQTPKLPTGGNEE